MQNNKPKYLLKYSGKEIENDSLDEIMRLAKTLSVHWEVFRVYKSAMQKDDRTKSVLTIANIEEVKRMSERGYSRDVIAKRVGLGRFYVDKIIGKHAVI